VEANGWMRGSLLRAGEFFPRKRLAIDPKYSSSLSRSNPFIDNDSGGTKIDV
jgi:hypothetical protein